MEQHWYDNPVGRERLRLEVMAMAEHFPKFRLRLSSVGRLWWVGIVEPIPNLPFALAIHYGRFPVEEPKLFVEAPSLGSAVPHRYQDSSLCVHQTPWLPDRSTAASMVGLGCEWLACYLIWQDAGVWPLCPTA